MKTISELVNEMTLDEKIAMVHGCEFFKSSGAKRLDIPDLIYSDGPAGVRQEFEPDNWTPIGQGFDKVTWLPSNTCLASTWNPDLAYLHGKILGEETKGRGKDIILGPGFNIKRTPLCGRNFEYLSEDPYLSAAMASPIIKGIQSSNVSACAKHFALNNQELDRMSAESIVDERTLFEIYLPAFEVCLRKQSDDKDSLAAGSLSVMASYNRYNDEYVCDGNKLLSDILRDKWHYDGLVVSDWGAVHNTVGSYNSTLDVEMSVTPNFDEYYLADPLKEKIENGKLAEDELNEKVKRILLLMKRLHMLDDRDERKPGCYNTFAHQQGALDIAREGIILLKNKKKHLPLSLRGKKVAIIGDNATRTHANGGGSSEINTLYDISPLLGLQMISGGDTEFKYCKGYYIDNESKVIGDVDWQAESLAVDYTKAENAELFKDKIAPKRKELLDEAVALAKDCDEVIFIGGLNHAYDVEGFDRPDMKLPYGQDELIVALKSANENLTVVLLNGGSVEMPWLDQVDNLIQSSYFGMNGSIALAEIITGATNPSGHLAETYPVKLSDLPAHQSEKSYPGIFEDKDFRQVTYEEGIMVGYRHFVTEKKKVAFPFGHGLSYSSFELSDLKTSLSEEGENVSVQVDVCLKNISDLDGKETVQLYIAPKDSPVVRPAYELKSFKKVKIPAKSEEKIVFNLDGHSFAYYDVDKESYLAKEGSYDIYVGFSSDDLPAKATLSLNKDYYFNELFR